MALYANWSMIEERYDFLTQSLHRLGDFETVSCPDRENLIRSKAKLVKALTDAQKKLGYCTQQLCIEGNVRKNLDLAKAELGKFFFVGGTIWDGFSGVMLTECLVDSWLSVHLQTLAKHKGSVIEYSRSMYENFAVGEDDYCSLHERIKLEKSVLLRDLSRIPRDWIEPLTETETPALAIDAVPVGATKPDETSHQKLERLSDCERLAEPLTQNDRDILVAMLEVKASKAKPASGQDLMVLALSGGDKNKAFRRLVSNALVEGKRSRGGGYWLTELGSAIAKKLT